MGCVSCDSTAIGKDQPWNAPNAHSLWAGSEPRVPETSTWLIDLFEEQGPTLHRLAVMLGAESESGHILRTSMLALAKRSNRIVDPSERLEYLAEQVVHQARAVRGQAAILELMEVAEPRQEEICQAVKALPMRLGELLVVSHYLSVFGPELAGIMRMTVRTCNHRLEEALDALRCAVGEPGPVSLPGIIESLSQELTAALRSSARLVHAPGRETLEAELRTLRDRRPPGAPLWLAAIIVVVCLGVGASAAFATRASRTDPLPAPTESVTATISSSRSLPSQVLGVPVYYVGRQDGKLYRELRDLEGTRDLVTAAMDAILVLAPLDPDYNSAWRPGRVLSVRQEGSRLTIDLSSTAFPVEASPEQTVVAINQMIYAAHDILGDPDLSVQFTANGEAPPAAFQGEWQRPGLEGLAKLWVNTPSNGQRLWPGTIVISGAVQPGVDQPRVLVTDASETLLSSQFAQTSTIADSAGWHTWTVSLPLEAGTYSIRVEATYPGEGGGTAVAQETRAITVR